jgi:hypothetical protein
VGSSEVELEACNCNWEEPVGWSERDGEGARINRGERDCHWERGDGPTAVESGPHDLTVKEVDTGCPGPAHGLQVQGLKGM